MSVEREILNEVLSGDVIAMQVISSWSDEEFFRAASGAQFGLGSPAVARVLRMLQAKSIDSDLAQRWASFMQRGYFTGAPERPTEPLSIEYDPSREDAVATAVMRLSELGDVVDGEFRPGEIDQLLAALEH